MTASRARHPLIGALLLAAAVARAQAPPPALMPAPQGAVISPPQGAPIPTPQGVREGVPARRVQGAVASATRHGNDALLAERPDDALAFYEKAQVAAPELPEIEYNRGLAALLTGDASEAARAFASTRDLAKPQPEVEPAPGALLEDAQFNASHAEWAQDRLPEAINGWASIIAQDPGATDARRNLELALRLLRQQQQQQQQQQQEQKEQPPQEEEKPRQEQGEQEKPGQEPKPDNAPPEADKEPQSGAGSASDQMTEEQAKDLLRALEAAEKQSMKEKSEKQARRVADAGGKDW
jgi:Ca-activated chloride channel family protein